MIFAKLSAIFCLSIIFLSPTFAGPFDCLKEAQHIKVLKERVAASNANDWKKWQLLHAKDACRTAPPIKGKLCGSAEMRMAIESLVHAFPNYKLTLLEAYGVGKKLTARLRAEGTFLNPLDLGDGQMAQPTGKSFVQEWVALIEFDKNGKIKNFDEFYDQMDLYIQLGAM